MRVRHRLRRDIDRAHTLLEEIVENHPKALKEPEPTIRVTTLADSSVNFLCRPWARTEDYWDVYWDTTKEVKKRFDAAGIGIPFPQRYVHLSIEPGEAKEPVAALAAVGSASKGENPSPPEGHRDKESDGTGDFPDAPPG